MTGTEFLLTTLDIYSLLDAHNIIGIQLNILAHSSQGRQFILHTPSKKELLILNSTVWYST